MPSIRNWKDLKMYRQGKRTTFIHIDPLFWDTTDWNMIKTDLPDMLRVVMSIKARNG